MKNTVTDEGTRISDILEALYQQLELHERQGRMLADRIRIQGEMANRVLEDLRGLMRTVHTMLHPALNNQQPN
jgi:hypothetical protein